MVDQEAIGVRAQHPQAVDQQFLDQLQQDKLAVDA